MKIPIFLHALLTATLAGGLQAWITINALHGVNWYSHPMVVIPITGIGTL